MAERASSFRQCFCLLFASKSKACRRQRKKDKELFLHKRAEQHTQVT